MNLVNELVSYNNSNVRVIGTSAKPWFCGIDVAKILGYTNAGKSIRVHVDDDDKTTFQTLMVDLWGGSILDPPHNDAIDKDGSKTIYINEPGLYSLILSSKLKSARAFRRWVISELLPEIRTRGEYKLKQTIVEKDNTIQEKDNALKEKDEKIEQLELAKLQIQNFVTNVKMRTQTDYIYILTTTQYAAHNNFKIGHTENLKNRLSGYNTGKAESDNYFYAYYKRVYEAQKLDKLLHDLLIDFKDNKNKENVIIHYTYLEKIIEFVSDNFNESFEYLNEFIRNDLANSYTLRPIVIEPKPLPLMTTVENEIIYSNCSEECIINTIKELIDVHKTLTRKQLIDALQEKRFNVNGSKRKIWSNAKAFCAKMNYMITY